MFTTIIKIIFMSTTIIIFLRNYQCNYPEVWYCEGGPHQDCRLWHVQGGLEGGCHYQGDRHHDHLNHHFHHRWGSVPLPKWPSSASLSWLSLATNFRFILRRAVSKTAGGHIIDKIYHDNPIHLYFQTFCGTPDFITPEIIHYQPSSGILYFSIAPKIKIRNRRKRISNYCLCVH